MKKVIGVVPLMDEKKDSYWMLPGYFKGIISEGGLPVMLPMTNDKEDIKQFMQMCDGFLFTGGHDVSPHLYGEKEIKKNLVGCCRERDEMELPLFQYAVENDKAVLGICRGIQFINVALGGNLYQDIPLQYPTKTEHHQNPPYDVPVHEVTIKKESPLFDLLGKPNLMVNSYHHQAVKKLATDLREMAVSEDGLIEAVYMPEQRFVWAVQWHPEFSYMTDENSRKIFREFVRNS